MSNVHHTNDASNPFHRFRALGYQSLIPIVPPDASISERSTMHAHVGTVSDPRGKTPGACGADGLWRGFDWLNAPAASDDDFARWHASGAGVGLRLGGGLYALDVDTLDPFLAEIVRRELMQILHQLPPRRTGRAPKFLVLLRCNDRLPYTRIEFEGHEGKRERVELLGAGRQCVVAGTHPKTGREYVWEEEAPALTDVCSVSAAQIEALFARLSAVLPACGAPTNESAERAADQSTLRGDPDTIRRAVEALPNTTALFATRNDYLKVGYAIKAALPEHEDEARELFLDWCDRWRDDPRGEGNDAGRATADWQRMKPPYSVGASWLYEMADAHGAGAFSEAALWFSSVAEAPMDALVFGLDTEPTDVKPRRLLPYVSAKVFGSESLSGAAVPIVDGLLDPGTLSVIYGASNVGKTFAAMDVFWHVATGRAWNGRAVTKGVVIYVVAEGGQGARKRIEALRRATCEDDASFFVIPTPIDLLRPDADLQPLIATVRAIGAAHGRVVAVVLDTLSRVLAGGDENSSVDMGALVRHFDQIRKTTGAAVVAVHHTGKDAAKGARGHSLLRAATDTEIEVADGAMTVTKQRDIETALAQRFELVSVVIGQDNTGRLVTSATVRWLDDSERVLNTKPTPRERDVLEAMQRLDPDNDGCTSGTIAGLVKITTANIRDALKSLEAKAFTRSNGARRDAIWRRRADSSDHFTVADTASVAKAAKSSAATNVFH